MAHKVKIHTDASFDPATGLATYAYWIETEKHAYKEAGVFPMKLDNSSVAELLAFEKAFRRLQQELGKDTVLKMHLTTDSLWVVEGLHGEFLQFSEIKPHHIILMKSVIHATKGHYLETSHIKAHTKWKSTKHHINNWCDKQANKLLREELGRSK